MIYIFFNLILAHGHIGTAIKKLSKAVLSLQAGFGVPISPSVG